MSSASKPNNQGTADARVTRASKSNVQPADEDPNASLEERLDSRLSPMEAAMEAMAAAVADISKKKDKKKRARESEDEQPSKKKKPKKDKAHKACKRTEQVPAEERDQTPSLNLETVGSVGSNEPPSADTCALTSAHTSSALTQFSDPGVGAALLGQHSTATSSSNQVNDVNKDGAWSNQVLAAGALGPPSDFLRPLSTKDPVSLDVQARVKDILETTATHLSKGTHKPHNFPYEYVVHGEDRKVATPNSVTLAEHIWGIIAMIKDPAISSVIKPALLEHIDHIVKDCRDYDWASAVRKWSEEVLVSWLSRGCLGAGSRVVRLNSYVSLCPVLVTQVWSPPRTLNKSHTHLSELPLMISGKPGLLVRLSTLGMGVIYSLDT